MGLEEQDTVPSLPPFSGPSLMAPAENQLQLVSGPTMGLALALL